MLLRACREREAFTPRATKWTTKWRGSPRQNREPVAAVQMQFEKDGTLGRIATHIQTEKTLNFLFEHARKTADHNADASTGGYAATINEVTARCRLTLRHTLLRNPVQVIIGTKLDEVVPTRRRGSDDVPIAPEAEEEKTA